MNKRELILVVLLGIACFIAGLDINLYRFVEPQPIVNDVKIEKPIIQLCDPHKGGHCWEETYPTVQDVLLFNREPNGRACRHCDLKQKRIVDTKVTWEPIK